MNAQALRDLIDALQHQEKMAHDSAVLRDIVADNRRHNPANLSPIVPQEPVIRSAEEQAARDREIAEQEHRAAYRREVAELQWYIGRRAPPFSPEAIAEMHAELREKYFGGKP